MTDYKLSLQHYPSQMKILLVNPNYCNNYNMGAHKINNIIKYIYILYRACSDCECINQLKGYNIAQWYKHLTDAQSVTIIIIWLSLSDYALTIDRVGVTKFDRWWKGRGWHMILYLCYARCFIVFHQLFKKYTLKFI